MTQTEEEKKEKKRLYYLKNKEYIRQRNRARYLANRQEIIKKNHEYSKNKKKTLTEEQKIKIREKQKLAKRRETAKRTEEQKEQRRIKEHIGNLDEDKYFLVKFKAWRRENIKIPDKEEFKKIWMETTHCQLCDVELIDKQVKSSSNRKCLEHDHESGYWRSICCHRCNMRMRRYDTIRMRVMCELHRYFNLYLN